VVVCLHAIQVIQLTLLSKSSSGKENSANNWPSERKRWSLGESRIIIIIIIKLHLCVLNMGLT
jgi:hypothetical protein